MQVVKRVSAPALSQLHWVYPWVAFRRMGGECVAGQVNPQELEVGVGEYWKGPALRAGRRTLDVQKGEAQGKRET